MKVWKMKYKIIYNHSKHLTLSIKNKLAKLINHLSTIVKFMKIQVNQTILNLKILMKNFRIFLKITYRFRVRVNKNLMELV